MTVKHLSKRSRTTILIRDEYTCQKCRFEDKYARDLEVHHIKPSIYGGSNGDNNLITLCVLCHKYAPNDPLKFGKYKESECDGQLATLLELIEKFKNEKKDLWEKAVKEHQLK